MPKVQTTMHVLRERADLTQSQLGVMLGRGQPEVSMWEWGKEKMPSPIRYQVMGILRAQLTGKYGPVALITADDLDRPWDDVLRDLDRRDREREASSALS